MKSVFIKLKTSSDLFLLSIFLQVLLVSLTILYYFNFNPSFYSYSLSLYFNELLFIINKIVIFSIGIIGSLWACINHKRTNNIQFVFYYCFNLLYIFEPFKILLSYFLMVDLKDEFYFLTKFYYFLFSFSLFNLFFLSLYICDFKIKSLNYIMFIIILLSAIFTELIPINSYDYEKSFNFLLRIENIRFYIDLTLFIVLFNFLIAFIKKTNFSYFVLFMSIFLILAGSYLNFLGASYSSIIISVGVVMYLKKAGKLFFYWL